MVMSMVTFLKGKYVGFITRVHECIKDSFLIGLNVLFLYTLDDEEEF